MSRKRNSGSFHKEKSIESKNQYEEIEKVSNYELSTDIAKSETSFTREDSPYEIEGYVMRKNCNKCKHDYEKICCKYNDDDCNFACDSERELLLRITCILINKEYGLKAIEQKIKKSELNDDIKNIKSISDLLERAIIGLGETALGAVKKAVEAAGTMTDITKGLANIAAGAAGTAGAVSLTSLGLANIGVGTAGTAGAASLIAAEAADAAAAGAVAAGAITDIAAETAGIATAGAATLGSAADIAAGAAGAAGTIAAISDTVAGAAETTAGAAATAAAISGTTASVANTAAGVATTAAAISDTTASVANTAAGTVKKSILPGTDGIHTEVVITSAVLDTDGDTIQVWVLNNNSEPTGIIDIIVYNLAVNPKMGFYMQSSAVAANSSVFFTIAPVPAVYEVKIQGLTSNIFAYAVSLNSLNNSLSLQKPLEARILCMYP